MSRNRDRRSLDVKKIATTTPNMFVEVTIGWDEGGINYFHGTHNPNKSYMLYAMVWSYDERGFKSTDIGTGGLKREVEVAERYSAKKLAAFRDEALREGSEVAKKMDELVAKLMRDKGLEPMPPHALIQLAEQATA